jgi:hypothetical protein
MSSSVDGLMGSHGRAWPCDYSTGERCIQPKTSAKELREIHRTCTGQRTLAFAPEQHRDAPAANKPSGRVARTRTSWPRQSLPVRGERENRPVAMTAVRPDLRGDGKQHVIDISPRT